MTRRKVVSVLLTSVMIAAAFGGQVMAATVNVTMADAEGRFKVAQEEVEVSDRNGDGKYTVDEALYAAHEAKYTGGASAGYGTASGVYGLYITKFIGTEGGSYGYYVNNKFSMSLDDEVKAGDYLYAYIYRDSVSYSDKCAVFDKHVVEVVETDEFELCLKTLGYDSDYKQVDTAYEGAIITIDGVDTSFITDENGITKIKVSGEGRHIISAKGKGTDVLDSPIAVVNVTKKAPKEDAVKDDDSKNDAVDTKAPATGDSSVTMLCIMGLYSILGVCAIKGKRYASQR